MLATPLARLSHRLLPVRATRDSSFRRFRFADWATLSTDMVAAPLAVAAAGGHPLRGLALLVLVLTVRLLAGRRPRIELSALDDIPGLAWLALGASTVTAALPVGPVITATTTLVIAGWYLVLTTGARLGTAAVLRWARRRGRLCAPGIVIGSGEMALTLYEVLRSHAEYGIRPELWSHDPVGALRRTPPVGAVFVVDVPGVPIVDVIRTCDERGFQVYVVPRLHEIGTGGPHAEHVWGIPCVPLRRPSHSRGTHLAKRVVESSLALAALVLLSPLMLAITLAVRWELGRGVWFVQERLTVGGRAFDLVKFRTLDTGSGRPAGPVGRLLRRSSLDELPQLWNVVRGDMSLVGPRPEQPHLAEELSRTHTHYDARLRLPAGITGLAQVRGLRGDDSSMTDRVRFDNLYIETWSPWQDVKIALQTVSSMLFLRGN